jgi:hypothetical protein
MQRLHLRWSDVHFQKLQMKCCVWNVFRETKRETRSKFMIIIHEVIFELNLWYGSIHNIIII